jgi:CubicO group peptidase (beta-lactamase class C family)
MKYGYLFLGIMLCISCQKNNTPTPDPIPLPAGMYFPAIGSSNWQTISADSLGWHTTALPDLYNYLQQKHSKAFIILKSGKIVTEQYFGSFTQDSLWYWASAGKTLTGLLVGIAQQEGYLSINEPTSKYLGTGWTSLPPAKEQLITIRNQLNMTTGLDDGVSNSDCTDPDCLQYKADAGSRWAYHNAPYTLLGKVVAQATGSSFSNYFQQKIRDKIGMNGFWLTVDGYNNVYYSNARSMARYGLLLLNKGTWNNSTAVLADTAYFNQQVNSSQTINPSYGYLTWLNGKAKHMLPQTQFLFNGAIIPNAPADMYCALGKNDQKVYVVPSQELVVIRMGESADESLFSVTGFDNELWLQLKNIIGY